MFKDKKNFIDISPKIDSEIAVWPGDKSFEQDILMDIKSGSHLHLSSINTTVHLGAHTDSPLHYDKTGEDISQRDLNYYFGPCQVVDATNSSNRIKPEDIDLNKITQQRVLFKTNSYPDPKNFNEDFKAFSPELINELAKKDVVLVGIDTPSVDLYSDKELLSHNAINNHNMAILEGLVLSHVNPGNYNLIAIPLPLTGLDASPVRAILY